LVSHCACNALPHRQIATGVCSPDCAKRCQIGVFCPCKNGESDSSGARTRSKTSETTLWVSPWPWLFHLPVWMPQYGSQRGLDYTERSVESKKQLGAVLAAAAKTLAEHASAHTLDRLKGYSCWSVADLREGTVWGLYEQCWFRRDAEAFR